MIPFNPYLKNITSVHTIPELNRPWGVAVANDGHIVVSEKDGDTVTILNRDGKKGKTFGLRNGIKNVKFSHSRGVAITPDKFILVADEHKIQKISMDGKCIESVGKEGSGPLEFDCPCGIAISPTIGHIYIADSNNHRIQVLNPDLTFSHTFGIHGFAVGQLNLPVHVAIDRQGLVYVTEYLNHRVQTFTPEGQVLCHFYTGQDKYPVGIAVDDNNLVYITESISQDQEGNRCVSIFTTDGQFIRAFGVYGSSVGQFYFPNGITFDRDGFCYVCDMYKNRIVVY